MQEILMAGKRRLLFIDDERFVLDGLQQLLRLMYRDWDMEFVESAQEALELMERQPFDVVVSDIRMPGMDGADLLKEVRALYPGTVRIALSGFRDDDTIFRSISPSHQFLAKPCTTEMLRSTLSRACALRDLLKIGKLQDMITRIETLPSLPSLFVRLLEELESPNASIKRIEEIISQDVSMTAKILKLVNSAYFGFRQHISSPGQAVVLLGLDTVRSLVLSVRVFSHFGDGKEIPGFSMEELWQHSLAVGTFSKRIAMLEKCDAKTIDHAFIAGMLHDVGRLVLATQLPDDYTSMLQLIKLKKTSFLDAELKITGTTHGHIGAYLLGLWGFPDPVVEAVAFHQCPSESAIDYFCPMVAVHAANGIAHEIDEDISLNGHTALDRKYLSTVKLDQRLPYWQDICQKTAGVQPLKTV
jgi:HD-like signal output (HDOD) protein/ActR/RegA family two-component response regulator